MNEATAVSERSASGVTAAHACRCEGPEPGKGTFWCERHQCHKTAHWHHLCQTRADYFRLWEEGCGPGQTGAVRKTSEPQSGSPKPARRRGESGCGCGGKKPSLLSRAWNLSKSLAEFAADGLRTVDKAEYERRLTICDGCDRRDGGRCTVCGCFLAVKAKGRVWSCPLGKWKSVARE